VLFDVGLSERMFSFVMFCCKFVNVNTVKRKCVFSATVNEEYPSSKSSDRVYGTCTRCYSAFMLSHGGHNDVGGIIFRPRNTKQLLKKHFRYGTLHFKRNSAGEIKRKYSALGRYK
jgi:hypothetical protein